MLNRARIAKRYVKALYQVARDAGQVDTVRSELAALRDCVRQSPPLAAFLPNYLIPRRTRGATLQGLFAGRVHPLVLRMLYFLEAKRRLALLPEVCVEFGAYCDREAGVLPGTIAAPFALSPEQHAAISQGTGRRCAPLRVELGFRLEPDLLGGFRVTVGDTVYDLSLATRLQAIRRGVAAI